MATIRWAKFAKFATIVSAVTNLAISDESFCFVTSITIITTNRTNIFTPNIYIGEASTTLWLVRSFLQCCHFVSLSLGLTPMYHARFKLIYLPSHASRGQPRTKRTNQRGSALR